MSDEHPITEIRVLYRDDAMVVVDKPSGIQVHRGAERSEVVAMSLIRDQLGQWVYPVHRLDAPTSGVLAFALSSEHARAIQASFAERRVEKEYLALVFGEVPERGVIDSPMRKNKRKKGGPEVEAITHYERLFLTDGGGLSYVRVRPLTGRMHQIRRHFRRIHHRLAGDVQYGRGPDNQRLREELGLHRLALHASRLTLPHPITGEPVHVRADLPDDLAQPLARAGVPPSHT